MKVCQETVTELVRSEKELEAAVMRKGNEISAQASKLDDERGLVGKVQKSIKKLQVELKRWKKNLKRNVKLEPRREDNVQMWLGNWRAW